MIKTIKRKVKTFFIYIVLLHIIRVLCDFLFPNYHFANLIRGRLFGCFFDKCGKNVAIASGCIINSAWNLRIGDNAYIAHNCWINAAAGLDLGSGVVLSPNVVIATTAHDRENGAVSLTKSRQSPISIGKGAWIAGNSVVTRGSVIGEGAIVGACSVVLGDLPKNALYSGNPAKLVKILPE